MGRLPGFSAELSLAEMGSYRRSAGSSGWAPDAVQPASPFDPPDFDATWVPDGSGHGTLSVTGSNFSPSGPVAIRVRDLSFFPVGFANINASPTRTFCPRHGPCRLFFGGNFQANVRGIPCNQGVVEVDAVDVRSGQTVSKYLTTYC